MSTPTTVADSMAAMSTPRNSRERAQDSAGESEPANRTQPVESALYVNDARYERLWALWKETRGYSTVGNAAIDGDVQRFLFDEARLLDERSYDQWLALFAAECLYWVPSRSEPGDPRTETGIYLDDRRRMLDRVAMIRTGHLHAQIPASRTRRMLSNIEQWTAADSSVRVRANVVIWEFRKGETRAYPGWQAYEIVRDPAGVFALKTKVVSLLDCDAPQGNYAFIL